MTVSVSGGKPFVARLGLLAVFLAPGLAQTVAAPQLEAALAALPAELRAAGRAVWEASEPRARTSALGTLAAAPAGVEATAHWRRVAPFVLALVEARQCPEDLPGYTSRTPSCLSLVAQGFRRTGDLGLLAALEKWTVSHPDTAFALAALDRLSEYRREQFADLLRQRALAARAGNDVAALTAIGRRQELIGSQLAAFLWAPPAVFEAKPAGAGVRVVAIGDSGTGEPAQADCAASIARLHQQKPFDFGITLGDNYQDDGPHSPTDPRWEKYWSRHYPAIGIPFYASLGNHDWNNPAGPAAALLYRNPAWKLPAPYYTYTAGPVQFFVINTVLFSEAQRVWLIDALKSSTARWKIVYGHFQIYSSLRGDNQRLIEDLLPVLEEHKADVYFCGHEHVFQHLKPPGRVHLFVNGASGAGGRAAAHSNYHHMVFQAEKTQGFTIVEAGESALTFQFVDKDGGEIYKYTLRK